MKFIEKNVLVFYLVAVVLGLIFHKFSSKFEFLIPFLIALIMYFSSVNIEIKNVIKTFYNLKGSLIVLVINFVLFPILILIVSSAVFGFESFIVAAMVFTFVLPTATTNVLYSNLLRGDTTFVLTMLVMTSLLSPILVPLIFFLLTRSIINVSYSAMFLKLVLIVVIPSIFASLTKIKAIQENSNSLASLIFIIVNFIAAGILFNSGILQDYNSLLRIFGFLFVFFVLAFMIVYSIFKKKGNTRHGVSMALITTRRNTSLGVGIASGTLNPIFIAVLLIYQYIHDISGLALRRYLK
tara:strand:- start:344 stop:1231 length:888 start_codon:yes stop_codon:yes gene_type:complete